MERKYVDDTTAFLQVTQSVLELISLLNKFETCSGLKINLEKTATMWLGYFFGCKYSGVCWAIQYVAHINIWLLHTVINTTLISIINWFKACLM